MQRPSMKKHIWIVPWLWLAGCSLIEPQVEPGQVLFQDDFSDTVSGWDRYHDETYSSNYEQSGYVIEILQPDTDAWANPRLDLADVQVEVDATKIDGPNDNLLGVLCRYQDPQNFYFFLISSDGYAGIGVYKEGRRQLLTGDTLMPSVHVVQGAATNHLRAECVGFRLSLYINGVRVADAQAAEWPTGDVGLIAGTYAEPGTRVLFDNFSVVQPEASP
jgi:hypothetical protein